MNKLASIVIVSHSELIAKGIKEMIAQISGDIVVEVAGGTSSGEIGTSLNKITKAIENASSEKGVVIFYDMGSAKMNVQLALELHSYHHIEIIDAPLVEGAYIAAVKASIGKSAQDIKRNIEDDFPNFFKNV